jgi:hypothetical protein
MLAAALPDLVDPRSRYENDRIRLRGGIGPREFSRSGQVDLDAVTVPVDAAAVRGLKFADVLPEATAGTVLAARIVDAAGARQVVAGVNDATAPRSTGAGRPAAAPRTPGRQ